MKSLKHKAALLLALLPGVALGQSVSFWGGTAVPATLDGGDGRGVEVGLKFRSDVAGSVTGVRFYKSPANTGAHVGNLWSSSGVKLASVTFTGETASGWQQAYFSAPVAIQANTDYVISYYAPAGHYSISQGYFSSIGRDVAPLHAPSGSNGVYRYGTSSRFPNQTWKSSNYWVDVIFLPNASTPPTANTVSFWNSSATPAVIDDGDTKSVELGLRFTSDVAGLVTGVKFYKGPNNIGTHVGNLWTSTGVKLASVTFTNETASGWQEADFTPAVAIEANTNYVISYHAPLAHYSTTENFFSANGVDTASLHAPAITNGVYAYGTGSIFPNQTWNASNYWVDVVFQPNSTAAPLATSTALSSSLNPSAAGQAFTLSARVTAASGTPAGSVQFFDGSTALATTTLTSGSASLTTNALSPGTHSLTAQYSGNGSYTASTSAVLVQTVSSLATTTALSSSLNPSSAGQAVTFVARVASASGTPTGIVQFVDGSTVIGSGTLASGIASMTTSSLSAATHSITARYGGDSIYSASASAPLLQTVNAASATATQTTLASSLNPSIIGQAVTFTAMVKATTGTPTGSVQFLDGATVIGTGALAGGAASVTVSSLSAGTHSISATYGGDSTYSGSSSSVLSQTVNPHTVSLNWAASASTNVAGYNLYRATSTSGPYSKLNSALVTGTSFTDNTVQSGQTYYYVCTAVDTEGTESGYSNAAQAVVPMP